MGRRRSLLKACLSCLSLLHRLRIQPGRKDHQVHTHQMQHSSISSNCSYGEAHFMHEFRCRFHIVISVCSIESTRCWIQSSVLFFVGLFVQFKFFFFFTVGKSTLSLVSFANYKWFEEWKDGKVTNRGPDYKELKQIFIDSILEVVMDAFPKITRDKVKILNLRSNTANKCVLWSVTPWPYFRKPF